MRSTFRWAACVLPLSLALACQHEQTSKSSHSQPPSNSGYPVSSKTPAQPAGQSAAQTPPTSQSELDAKANNDINEKNSDAEFEKLKNEIEGGG